MKTKLLALALVGIFAFSGAMAQEQGDVRAGLGLVMGSKSGFDTSGTKAGFGLAPSIEYMITDAISGAITYDWYFPSSVAGTDIKISYFNIDARYYFVTGDTQVYGLAGLGMGMADPGDSETGLNIGAGAIFPLSDVLGANAQLKYQTPGDGQIAITAGVVYTF